MVRPNCCLSDREAHIGSRLLRTIADFPPSGAGEQLALPILAEVKTSMQCHHCLPSGKHLLFQPPPSRYPQLGVKGWLWPQLCSMSLPVRACLGVLDKSWGAMLYMKLCSIPSPLCMWPELCPDASIPAMMMVPGCCSSPCHWAPLHMLPRTHGGPICQALHCSFAALTVSFPQLSAELLQRLLPSRPWAALTVGVSISGLHASVLSLLGRQGKARQGDARNWQDSLSLP